MGHNHYILLMSNTINTINNKTTTSTPRSKKNKYTKVNLTDLPTDAKTEVKTTEVPVLETVVETIPQPSTNLSESHDEKQVEVQIEKLSEEQEPSKPTVNVWKVRKEATEILRQAQEALYIAEQAHKTANKAVKATLVTKETNLVTKTVANSKQEDNNFTFVTKKKFVNKPNDGYQHKPTYQPKNASFTYQRKELTKEEQSIREHKTQAFDKAQSALVDECVKLCPQSIRDDINTSIQYTMGFRKTLVLDITNDDIVVEVDGEKHVYSRLRFLENRYFQNNVRDKFATFLPNAWIRFFPGRTEGSYCMGIQRKHD